MPPEDKCSLEFIGQILRGEKKILHLDDIKPVKVADKRFITVKNVCEQVKNNEVYMRYLPDKPSSAGRQFIFNIVNTLDPDYFRYAQREVEKRRIAKAHKEKEEQVELCPEMDALMNQFTDMNEDRRTSTQSLAMLKLGAKKRRKPERQPVPELFAKIK